jgi:hypothetical protein
MFHHEPDNDHDDESMTRYLTLLTRGPRSRSRCASRSFRRTMMFPARSAATGRRISRRELDELAQVLELDETP